MSDNSLQEEWLKLVLSELRKNNDKMDLLKKDFDDKFSDVEKTINSIVTKVTELDVHVEDTQKDIANMEYTLKGNGTPGLKTKVELIEKDIYSILKDQDEIESKIDNKISGLKLEEYRDNKTVKMAIIGGASSGFLALLKVISDIFVK